MDRLTQLRGEAGGSRDSSLDTLSPSEAYVTASESTKFFSLSEVDSTFDITPIKDVSLASTAAPEKSTERDQLISDLSPIPKKNDLLDSYKFGKQIEAANILSGGVNIFDDNDNSYDGDELVIDDNVDIDEKSSSELKNTGLPFEKTEDTTEPTLVDSESAIESKDTEVVLQIDGKNVNAITIGNGLYLYRKEGEEELAAVQIIDDDQQQPSFKFLKVRENAEGNLEVYEEIQIEVPKEVPAKDEKTIEKNASHVPIKDISKVVSDTTCNKVSERSIKTHEEILPSASTSESVADLNKDSQTETKTEVNVNGKMVKYNETRKSPVIHSTPNKEGIPLTKTMVDLKLHPNRQLDKVKTIEVHTDSCKQRLLDTLPKNKDTAYENKSTENISTHKMSDSNDKVANTDAPESHLNDKVNSIVQEIHVEKLNTDILEQNENVNAVALKTNLNDKVDTDETIPLKPDKIIDTKVNVMAKPEADRSDTQTEQNEQDNKELETPCKYESNVGIAHEEVFPSNKVDVDSLSESKTETINTESTKHDPVDSAIDIQSNMFECDKSNSVPDVISKKIELDNAEKISQSANNSEGKDQKALQNFIPKHQNIPIEQAIETTQIPSRAKEHDLKESNSKSETVAFKTVLGQGEHIVKKNVKITEIFIGAGRNVTESQEIKQDVKVRTKEEVKPINNNHAAVPFGKWTEVNRQDFLNKIKETNKINCPNTNQLKQANDLNRRDVLQKIDSQRQSFNATKHQEASGTTPKLNVKNDTKSFASRSAINQDSKIPVKSETVALKVKPTIEKQVAKQESVKKLPKDQSTDVTSNVTSVKKECIQKKELNYQHLIDKTIEDMINRAGSVKTSQDELKQNDAKTNNEKDTISHSKSSFQPKEKEIKSTNLDAIEMKMNELHGIPFVERPPHELPKIYNHDIKTYSKTENPKAAINKLPNLLPFTNKHSEKPIKSGTVDVDSDDEIIEHEPITGDIAEVKKSMASTHSKSSPVSATVTQSIRDSSKKESIITEKDFDKFARRNSFTYENCLTVNYEGNEPHNVIQTVIEKDIPVKKYSRNERLLAEAKVKSSHKHQKIHLNSQGKIQIASKLVPVNDDTFNKNCQSKFQIAYQSALAKRQMESPITIIEDKPVKVVFMDANSEFVPSQLNVQGQDLSPTKKIPEPDAVTVSTCDSLDSEVLDAINDTKPQDDATHRKHQRKQVLTPVETPELELIEPSDLGLEVSPKKKRKIEDMRTDRNPKTVVPKKSYLLGRNTAPVEETPVPVDVTKNLLQETINHSNAIITHNDTASAIDNLVKAAELLETQSENLNRSSNTVHSDNSQQSTPVKRGRGRPRKHPLPEGAMDKNKVSSPQKKPQLIDAKKMKYVSDTDDTSDDEMILKKENWTMGKINENIVCPICNKLFRSENVVFKHVKHCSGPSPNRSDSDIRSSRRSVESDTKSRESKSEDMDIEEEKPNVQKYAYKKRKSRDIVSKSTSDKEDLIVIEDTPVKEKLEAQHGSRNMDIKTKTQHRTTNLACEICGKTFRQLSYLVSHKLQHKKDDPKKTNDDTQTMNKSLFSCEVCKKEFRKLHHLVQHRIIHNPSVMPSRSSRKSLSEQNDNKIAKNQDSSKQNEDQSAAFRCEPCDKSFRKLHHLVEHRETHDGKSRQKNNTVVASTVEKPTPAPPPQCDVCKKTFRKLHHMIEHKEQHLETCSEKSDDKSVKSSLSTRDIIHECSLCYMVFPNEHSLNKHSVICQRKKRQSAAKKTAQMEKNEIEETEIVNTEDNEVEMNDTHSVSEEYKMNIQEVEPLKEQLDPPASNKIEDVVIIPDNSLLKEKVIESTETKSLLKKEHIVELDKPNVKNAEILDKIKKIEEDVIVIQDTPKKKVSVKDKVAPTVTKRQKAANPPPVIINEPKTLIEISDDDDIRYMFNPDFKAEESTEEKVFMTVKAKKRNSLQIERPKSKDSVNRIPSSQHPPKIPRLKPKPFEVNKNVTKTPGNIKNVIKSAKSESVPSTDSDDSDVKYSFPKTHVDKTFKSGADMKSKDVEKRTTEKRKSLAEKRKSFTAIGKGKSTVKVTTLKQKHVPLVKPVKRRNTEVEHRCDCGQLFSSAALLSRHTTLAHTPPRIRRRRSPPPDLAKTKISKLAPQRQTTSDKLKPSESRKSSVKTDTGNSSTKITGTTSTTRSMIKDKGESANSAAAAKVGRYVKLRGEPLVEKIKKKTITEMSKK